jgi:hypothetical protein
MINNTELAMNEQIEKIYGEACIHYGYLDEREFLEKFAQLLIKKCIDKISQEQDIAEQNWQCKNGVHICYELTKHFGVNQ